MDLQIWVALGTWLFIVSSIQKVSSYAEEVVSASIKDKVRSWLYREIGRQRGSNWPAIFCSIFDCIFGVRRWSARFFSSSCLASLLWVLVLYSLWIVLHPIIIASFGTSATFHSFGAIALFAVVLNFVPDYVCLVKSRIILGIMAKRSSLISHFVLTSIDVLIGFGIWLVTFFLFCWIKNLAEGLEAGLATVRAFNDSFNRPGLFAVPRSQPDPGMVKIIDPINVFLYSTLLTSLWAWTYFLSAGVIRLSNNIARGIFTITPYLNMEKNPLRSIGFVASLLVTVIYWTVVLVCFLSR